MAPLAATLVLVLITETPPTGSGATATAAPEGRSVSAPAQLPDAPGQGNAPDSAPVPGAAVPDAGSPFADPLYAQCPEAAPPLELPDGSWSMTRERGARNACLMATCAERVRQLEATPVSEPLFSKASLLANLILWGLGLVAGVYLGWQLRAFFFK